MFEFIVNRVLNTVARSMQAICGVVFLTALGCWTTASSAQSAPPACALKVEDLAKLFGVAFEAGVPEPAIGTSCRYQTRGGSSKNDTDFSLFLLFTKPSGPVAEFRKLMGGPGHQYVEFAGDADRAVWVKHGGGVAPFPSISYERGGYLVEVKIAGLGLGTDANARAARVGEINQRLLKLPRVP